MEENKVEEKKVEKKNNSSLPIVVFIFVMLILIGAIVYLCITFENSRKEDQKTIDGLKASIKSEQETNLKLKTTIDDLQGKIDDIDDTLSGTTKTTEDKTQNTPDSTTEPASNSTSDLSEAKATEVIDNYLQLIAKNEMAGNIGLLKYLGLDNNYDKDDYIPTGPHSQLSKATNITYADFKTAMLSYISEKYFENQYTERFVEKDGNLYYDTSGGGTGYSVEVEGITLEKHEGDKYIYIVDRKTEDIADTQHDKITVTIVKENGKYVVDSAKFGQYHVGNQE